MADPPIVSDWLNMSSLEEGVQSVGQHTDVDRAADQDVYVDFVGVCSPDTVNDKHMDSQDDSIPQALCEFVNTSDISGRPVSVSDITRQGIVSENVPGSPAQRSSDTRLFTNNLPINYTSDDVFHVENDTSALFTVERRRSPHARHGRDRPLPSRDASELTNGIAHGDHVTGYPGHACHSGQKQTVDKMARNQLIVVSVLCFLFMIAEIVGGLLSHSLALVTDATHLASDLTSFLVSLFAVWLATKPPTNRMTFGYHRAEVVGALISVVIIWIATGVLVYLGVKRIQNNDYVIEPDKMLITAGIGVGFNIVMAIVLHSGLFKKCNLPTSLGHNHSHGDHSHGNHNNSDHGRHSNQYDAESIPTRGQSMTVPFSERCYDSIQDPEQNTSVLTANETTNDKALDTYNSNINIRAAVLHVIGDLIQSIGVFIAAVVIKVKPEYKLADPICTFVFSVLVLCTTITVLRDVGTILMEAAPRGLDIHSIKKGLKDVDGVRSVHSLHVWSLTINKVVVAVHLGADDDFSHQEILNKARNLLRSKHHVINSVIQVENYDDVMSSCSECLR